VDIDGRRRGDEVEDADVAVEIEGALDLRQIVLGHQRLLEHEQQADAKDPAEIQPAEPGHAAEREERDERDDVHRPRDRQRAAHAEAHGNRAQPLRTIEVQILARVQHVEPADPAADRQPEEPGLRCPRRSARGEPSADRGHRHRQTEEQLRIAGHALRQGVPEHDRQRHR